MNKTTLAKAAAKRALIEEEKLNNKYTLTFTKRELTIMFNILVRGEYRIGDAVLIWPIVQKLEPIVATASSAVPEPVEAQKKVDVTMEDSN